MDSKATFADRQHSYLSPLQRANNVSARCRVKHWVMHLFGVPRDSDVLERGDFGAGQRLEAFGSNSAPLLPFISPEIAMD
jgi:hypothetical protein